MNHIIVRDTCFNIRKGAREALAGRWKDAAIATIVLAAVLGLPTTIAYMVFGEDFAKVVSNIYMIAVSGPFTLGYSIFMLKLFRNEAAATSDVFSGFEQYGKAVLLYIVTTVFIVLWSLLLIIPGIIASYRYRLVYYILCDNPNIGVLEAINESKRLMTGNKGKLFLLDLSFIGWCLVSVLTFGLGFIMLYPYQTAATVAFYEITNGNLKAKIPDITYGLYVSEHPEDTASHGENDSSGPEKL